MGTHDDEENRVDHDSELLLFYQGDVVVVDGGFHDVFSRLFVVGGPEAEQAVVFLF